MLLVFLPGDGVPDSRARACGCGPVRDADRARPEPQQAPTGLIVHPVLEVPAESSDEVERPGAVDSPSDAHVHPGQDIVRGEPESPSDAPIELLGRARPQRGQRHLAPVRRAPEDLRHALAESAGRRHLRALDVVRARDAGGDEPGEQPSVGRRDPRRRLRLRLRLRLRPAADGVVVRVVVVDGHRRRRRREQLPLAVRKGHAHGLQRALVRSGDGGACRRDRRVELRQRGRADIGATAGYHAREGGRQVVPGGRAGPRGDARHEARQPRPPCRGRDCCESGRERAAIGRARRVHDARLRRRDEDAVGGVVQGRRERRDPVAQDARTVSALAHEADRDLWRLRVGPDRCLQAARTQDVEGVEAAEGRHQHVGAVDSHAQHVGDGPCKPVLGEYPPHRGRQQELAVGIVPIFVQIVVVLLEVPVLFWKGSRLGQRRDQEHRKRRAALLLLLLPLLPLLLPLLLRRRRTDRGTGYEQ